MSNYRYRKTSPARYQQSQAKVAVRDHRIPHVPIVVLLGVLSAVIATAFVNLAVGA